MTKSELSTRTSAAWQQTHDSLQTVYDSINPGQKKQIVKVEAVKVLFERYGIITEVQK